MRIFSGVKCSLDTFCLRFSDYLVEFSFDEDLTDFIKGRKSSYRQNKDTYRQFKVVEESFQRLYGTHLVIQEEKSGLFFYLGEDIIITEAVSIKEIQAKPHLEKRLRILLRTEVYLDVYVLV